MSLVRRFSQHMLMASMCCSALAGCGGQPALSDPTAAKELLNKTLEAWKSGQKPDDLKSQSPPIYVGDSRWASGSKLHDFTILGEGDYHQSSVRIPVRMKLDKDAKPREFNYWVTTNPANSVTLAE